MRAIITIAVCLAQIVDTASKKRPFTGKPECSSGAICFTGEVHRGEAFHHSLNGGLDFVLIPARLENPGGWTMEIEPKRPEPKCGDFVYVVNPPYRQHSVRYIDTSYGWTAEEAVDGYPRDFNFITNCADYARESQLLNRILWPRSEEDSNDARAKRFATPLGKGRLWITASKVTHAHDSVNNKPGTIEWIQFAVEVKLPPASLTHTRIPGRKKP